MENTTETTNGQSILTPSKLKLDGTTSFKYKRKHDDTENEKNIDYLYDQLSQEKQNNEFLKKELSEMRMQLSELTKTITNLNETINKLQTHNSKLLKAIQKSSKNHKTPEKLNEKNDTKNTTQKHTSTPEDDSPNNTGMTHQKIKHNTPNKEHTKPTATTTNSNVSMKSILSIDSDSEEDEIKTNTQTNNIEAFQENEKVQRTSKIPPIDIWTENQQATQILIRHHMPNYSCIFNIINKTKMRVIPKTIEIRSQLLKLLTNRKIEYNTYTPSDDKMQNILLKGTEIKDSQIIKETLEKNGIQPHNIQTLVTGYMKKNNITSNIWQITLQPKTDINKVLNIRYIEQWSVKWETMKKRQITQCRRCQRFNHSASNCTLAFRCVKCTNEHKPGECPLDSSNNKTKPTCVNCKGEHTANNARLCPAFRKQIEIKEQKKKPNQHSATVTRNEKYTTTNNHNTKQHANTKMSYTETLKQQQSKQTELRSMTDTLNNNKNNKNIQQILEENQQSMRNMLNTFMETQYKMMSTILNQQCQ